MEWFRKKSLDFSQPKMSLEAHLSVDTSRSEKVSFVFDMRMSVSVCVASHQIQRSAQFLISSLLFLCFSFVVNGFLRGPVWVFTHPRREKKNCVCCERYFTRKNKQSNTSNFQSVQQNCKLMG